MTPDDIEAFVVVYTTRIRACITDQFTGSLALHFADGAPRKLEIREFHDVTRQALDRRLTGRIDSRRP